MPSQVIADYRTRCINVYTGYRSAALAASAHYSDTVHYINKNSSGCCLCNTNYSACPHYATLSAAARREIIVPILFTLFCFIHQPLKRNP